MGQCQSAKDVLPSLEIDNKQRAEIDTLIRRAQAREFPLTSAEGNSKPSKVSDLGRSGGHCILFLEKATSVPYHDFLRDATCEAVNAKSHGHPYVVAWAETSAGEVIGKVAEWPSRNCNAQPAWFSARSLGFALAEQPAATLRVELREGGSVLGSLQTPLQELQAHKSLTMDLQSDAKPGVKASTVSFQILDSKEVLRQRIVYFVRHGESQWNKAQGKLDLQTMASKTDHPLSAKGWEQAESLNKLLDEQLQKELVADKTTDASVSAMLRPGVVFTSPLARAIQTAVIAIGPVLAKAEQPERRELVLLANAKEKQNFGGLDTHCTKIGRDILDTALEELRSYPGEAQEERPAVDAFFELGYDLEEVQDAWWPEGQSETSKQLEVRLQEFMLQLMYSAHDSIVVFGHSLFFQQIFRKYLSSELRRGDDIAQDLKHKKLPNCGVVRLELDPLVSLEDGPFVEAQLVLGTEFEPDGNSLMSCCSAPGPSETKRNEFVEASKALSPVAEPESLSLPALPDNATGTSHEEVGQLKDEVQPPADKEVQPPADKAASR